MKNFIILLILLSAHLAHSQQWVGLGLGGHLTDVDFTNNAGEKDDRIKGIPSMYTSFFYQRDLGANKKESESRNSILLEAGYKKGTSKNSESTTLETWTMDFISVGMQFRHYVGTKSPVSPFFGIGGTLDYLFAGVQQEGLEQYDLTGDLKSINLGVVGESGLSYYIDQNVISTLSLSYTRGITNMEEGNQTARISGFRLGLGIFFQLNK